MSIQVCMHRCARTFTHTHTHTAAAAAATGKRCAFKLPILWPGDSRGEIGSEGRDQKWYRDRQGCASKPCPHQGETGFNLAVRLWKKGDRRHTTPT